jgi:putative hydrolase
MTPFGFGPPDDPNGENSGQNPENFDINEMMRQMQSEFQKISPQFGFMNPANLFGAMSGGAGSALPKDVIREVAKTFIQTQGSQPIGANDEAKCEEAFSIANTWLDQATVFPMVASDHAAISPMDWLYNTVEGWHSTFEPLAVGLTDAVTKLVEEATGAMQAGQVEGLEGLENLDPQQAAMAAQLGPMAMILRGFIGSMLATQMGQTIGALASASKGSHDAALPLTNNAEKALKPSLLPQTLRKFGAELEIPETEIAIFFALREAAIARLFESNPWLVSYMKAAIAEYGKGIHIDLDAIQRQAEETMRNMQDAGQEFDPQNAESFTIALNNGLFTPEESPQQAAALEKLETALALIDGWVEEVITLAADNRLPSLASLSELLRRERVSNSPIQQLFKALFNLEVSPKRVREATFFWHELREKRDLEQRDKVWSGILPTEKELSDPIAFIGSTEIPDDISKLFEN